MKISVLEKMAALIAESNLTPHVDGVRVEWEESTAKLMVQYFVSGDVSDYEREYCELTLTELLAEFPEVRMADAQCLKFPEEGLSTLSGIVFHRM